VKAYVGMITQWCDPERGAADATRFMHIGSSAVEVRVLPPRARHAALVPGAEGTGQWLVGQ